MTSDLSLINSALFKSERLVTGKNALKSSASFTFAAG